MRIETVKKIVAEKQISTRLVAIKWGYLFMKKLLLKNQNRCIDSLYRKVRLLQEIIATLRDNWSFFCKCGNDF